MNRREFLRSAALPASELAMLLAWQTGEQRAQVYLDLDREIPRRALQRLQRAIGLRREGWPLQYVVGTAWFWSHPIRVGPGVLVPRPETELLVEEVLRLAPQDACVADIGTGSGAIALALAAERPDLSITAVDRSRRALRYARKNLAGIANVLEGDLLGPLPRVQDVIVSNPPYVPSGTLPRLQREVRREPRMALVGGTDGLRVIRRLARQSPAHLAADGWLVFEFGVGQLPAAQSLLLALGYRDVGHRADLAGIPRVIWGRRPC